MSRLTVVDPANAGEATSTLNATKSQLGVIPNLFKVAANSPAALSGLVQLSGALGKAGWGRVSASKSLLRSRS